MKPYKSPLKTLALIIFCIIIAIILREIVRAEEVDPVPVKYEVISYEEYLARYEPSESPTIGFEIEVEEQVNEGANLLTVEQTQPEVYTITAYCSCEICCGEWSDGFTYSGELAHEGVTIAADLSKLPLGTVVEIEGIGERVVQDKGGAIKGNRIDLFFYHHSDALAFGVQELEVTVIE